jgi:hypothetical protein
MLSTEPIPWELFAPAKGANPDSNAGVCVGMNTKPTKTKLSIIILGFITALFAGCVSTGAGTATIDPPAPAPGLPDPPAVTVPTP